MNTRTLCSDGLRDTAKQLAKNVYMVDEFLSIEADLGNIRSDMFKAADTKIKLHGHCQQKALSQRAAQQKDTEPPRGLYRGSDPFRLLRHGRFVRL